MKRLTLINPAVCIGLESTDEASLALVRKDGKSRRRSLEYYAESIARLHAHGIGVVGSFILGIDTQDMQSMTRARASADAARHVLRWNRVWMDDCLQARVFGHAPYRITASGTSPREVRATERAAQNGIWS